MLTTVCTEFSVICGIVHPTAMLLGFQPYTRLLWAIWSDSFQREAGELQCGQYASVVMWFNDSWGDEVNY